MARNTHFITTLFLLLIMLSLASGIFAEETVESTNTDAITDRSANTKRCLLVGSITDWQALDRKRLLIWAPSKQHPFLVELNTACHGLYNGETLAIQSRDNRLCDFGGDSLWIDGERCSGSIQSLQSLSPENAALLLEQ